MALYFNAAVNCGADRAAAETIAAVFDDFAIQVGPEIATVCKTSCEKGEDGYWATTIMPKGAWYGSEGERPELMTDGARLAIAGAIFEKLRTCRGFLVAIVGEEAQDWIAFCKDRDQFVAPVVVRADVRQLVSSSLELEPFSAGYLWVPPPQLRAPRP